MTDHPAGRPLLVSVIAFYYGCGAIFSIIARYFLVTHLDLVPATMRSQFQSFSWTDNAVLMVLSTIRIWAAISLFRLKEYAVLPLLVLFALAIINTLRYIFFKNWLNDAPGPALVGVAIGFLLNACILFYVVRLRKRGILRSGRGSSPSR